MKAYELIEQTGWCQGTFARGSDGEVVVDPRSEKARSFCVLGALRRVNMGKPAVERMKLYDAMKARFHKEFDIQDIVMWNDAPKRTKYEVVALLKKLDL